MALARIKNPEQLKNYPPGELGKLLGLDRVPEVGHFRKKLKQLIEQGKSETFHAVLFTSWVEQMPEMFFYIDGHVSVYHGKKANLPKRFVSRERLCLAGTTEFWLNNQSGMPLMVISAALNEKLKQGIETAIEIIKEKIPKPSSSSQPHFTLVFDREGYEPKWFKKLWEDHQIAVITYRKNVKDKWREDLFENHQIDLYGTHVTMQLCEMGTLLSQGWFREIRKLSTNGHQTSILTTHPSLALNDIALKMFSRWTQENYFKYVLENFHLDRILEYGVEEIDQTRTVVNPAYRKLSNELKKTREKKTRLEAKIYNKIEFNEQKTIDQIKDQMISNALLIEQIDDYKQEIIALQKLRETKPARISLAEMDEEKRYNKLKEESKKYKNAIIMLAYRAETALHNILKEFFKGADNNGRMLLKEIFSSDADMIPDYEAKTLTIALHCLSTPRANQAVGRLCELLNDTQTEYPDTKLKMIFKSVAL